MPDAYDIVIAPVQVTEAEAERWKTRLLNAKQDMIAGVQATDYAEALQKAIQEYYNKVIAPGAGPVMLRGYAKLAARLPTVDPEELKQKLVQAIQSESFDEAVNAAVDKWTVIMSLVKGAGIGGRELGNIIARYVSPDVAPFTVPSVVAATVMLGYYGLILARAVNNGYPEDQADAMLSDMANRVLRPVLEKILSGDATLVALTVDMTPGENPTVAIHIEIEAGTGNTTQAA